jgi:hypothetical protein
VARLQQRCQALHPANLGPFGTRKEVVRVVPFGHGVCIATSSSVAAICLVLADIPKREVS